MFAGVNAADYPAKVVGEDYAEFVLYRVLAATLVHHTPCSDRSPKAKPTKGAYRIARAYQNILLFILHK